MSFVFNDFIGPETISREYKEFSLHKTGVPFSIHEAEHYCETNTFDFDELVKSNIKKYILQYLPKYVCGFWNSGIDGEMYIGTDDYGFIKGIPLSIGTTMDKDSLLDYIKNTLYKMIKTEDGKQFEVTSTIDILKVEKPEKINTIHRYYASYQDKKQKFLQEYKEFIERYHEWQKTYEYVNMKLVDIVNIPEHRRVLIDYVEKSPYRNERALELLYGEYQLPYLPGEDIKDSKNDTSSVFYWVTHFKDELCVQYKKNKPTFIKRFKYRNIPFNLIISLSDMIPHWTDQIDLYVIRIQCGKPPQNTIFSYYTGTQWIRCNRIMDPSLNQPMCIPESL